MAYNEIKYSNILYNFIISPILSNEEYLVSERESEKISGVYPTELDFTKKDSYIINYITEKPEKLMGMKLNNDSSNELECVNKRGLKECNVTKKHFKKNGWYHTYHYSSFGYQLISYEVEKIKVFLQEEKEDKKDDDDSSSTVWVIVGSILGGLVLIGGIILILLLCCCGSKKSGGSGIELGSLF